MPTKQITSEQPLVEVALANGDICHVNLQSVSQQESHAGHTYNLDRCSIGARDVLGRLLLHGQPVGIHPLLHQQGDGCTHVDHQEALSSLAPGLVTPCDLPGNNADGGVWLVSQLLQSFGWYRPSLARLEPAHRHTYQLDDQGVGRLGQDTWRVGFSGLRHGGWWHDDWRSYFTQSFVLKLLCHGHYSVAGSCQHIVHQFLLILHCFPGTFARKPFGQACHCRGELVQPGL